MVHVPTVRPQDILTTRFAATAALLLAASAFCLFQFVFARRSGLWLDELFAMWASDPSLSLARSLRDRILPDPNPPAYFTMLYALRHVLSGETAVIALNIAALGAALLTTVLWARRAKLQRLARVAISFFLLSGPVLYYFSEGRTYLCALAVVFCASWIAAQSVSVGERERRLMAFAVIGIIAALVHVYAALYCCALAAGLCAVGVALPDRRASLWNGLALGGAAAFITALAMLPMRDVGMKVFWIKFDWQHVLAAAGKSAAFSAAPLWILIALVLILAIDRMRPATRSLICLFAITCALFLLLPILISFRLPIVSARYWVIGAPGLIVFAAFLFCAWAQENPSEATGLKSWRASTALAVGALGVIFASFAVAYVGVSSKLAWRGGTSLKALASVCNERSIRVASSYARQDGKMSADGSLVPGFAYLTTRPESVFIDVSHEPGSLIADSDTTCPVLGWAENIDPLVVKNASAAELLQILKIDAATADVDIDRQTSGYVVLRKPR